MRRMVALSVIVAWAWGCPTSIAPFPDVGGQDPGGTDPGRDLPATDVLPSDLGTDPGRDVPADPGAGTDHSDVLQDPGGLDAPSPGDTAEDPLVEIDVPPEDPCGPATNPQCRPAACATPGGGTGTCQGTVGGACRCVGDQPPPQCTSDRDCINRQWFQPCEGHWDCLDGTCGEVCGRPCGDQACDPDAGESPLACPSDCPPQVPCRGNGDCPGDSWCALEPGDCGGAGTCQVRPTLCPRIYQPVCGCDGNDYPNRCQAAAAGVGVRSEGVCPAGECTVPRDCLGRPWLVDCMGHWACSDAGACQEVCDFESCGDDRCDGDLGEDSGTCPRDCRVDLCSLQAGPFCLPWDCDLPDGSQGRCGSRQDGACLCGPRFGTCTADRDCLGQTWPIRCLGHWDCENGSCEPRCGDPCGNRLCEPAQGEDRTTCSPDCPDRDTRCDDGTVPLCEMVPPTCNEWEILAWQNSCFACVNPATCRPWGEPGCARDAGCPADQWCSPCGTSSCPLCDNCIPACVPHGCPTEPVAQCKMVRPDCGEGAVAVVKDGCWVCVDRATCR